MEFDCPGPHNVEGFDVVEEDLDASPISKNGRPVGLREPIQIGLYRPEMIRSLTVAPNCHRRSGCLGCELDNRIDIIGLAGMMDQTGKVARSAKFGEDFCVEPAPVGWAQG